MTPKPKRNSNLDKSSARNQSTDRLAYLAHLLDNISDALISTDMEFKVLEWNAAAESMYGWKATEVMGRPAGEFILTEYNATTRDVVIQSVLETGVWKGEVTQNRKDGTRFPVMISISFVKGETGEPIGFVTVNRDVSEHKQIEDQLRQSEERFSKTFHSTPTALVLARLSDSKFESVNESFLDLVDYQLEDVIGKSPAELNLFPNPAQLAGVRQTLIETKKVRNLETVVRTRMGEIKHVLFAVDIIQLNQQPYSLTTMIDITERVQAEKKVIQMKHLYATLSQVNQTIVHVKSREDLYQSICNVALKFGELSMSWVGLLDKTGDVQPVAMSGMNMDIAQWPFPIINIDKQPPHNGVIAEALHTSNTCTSDDVQTDERTKALHDLDKRFGFRSLAAVPFRLRGKTIGVLVMISIEPGIFNAEEERKLLDEMGLDISFALDTMETEAERKQVEEDLRESEHKYSVLFQSSAFPAALQQLPAGTLVDVNTAFQELVGYTRQELLGKTTLELGIARPADPAKVRQKVEREGMIHTEMRIYTKSGAERMIIIDTHVISLGEQPYVLSTMQDITDRKQAEEQIQRQLKHLNALRNIDVAIITSFELNDSLDVVLEQVLSQLSVDAASILLFNSQTQMLEYAASRGVLSSAIQHAKLELGEGYAGQAILERKMIRVQGLMAAGGEFAKALQLANENFVEYFGTPLIVKGEVIGVLEIYHRAALEPSPEWLDFLEILAGQAAIAIDNAQLFESLQRSNAELEQRVAQRTAELNQTNIELEHANRAKDEFLANMSHELRTPLNSILGLSETLLEQSRDPLKEHQQRYIQTIASSGQHLLDLINDILDLSKIEAGKFDYFPQAISVDEICRSSFAFVKSQAVKKSISLAYIQDFSVEKIFADPRRLKQILVNLLTNAVKFTPEKGEVILKVKAELEKDLIQFVVIDTGIGIASEGLHKLFQPFVQVDSSLNRQQEGTGLGLALVQRLADLHGGSVQVESEAGKGSSFTVNLPCRQVEIAKLEPQPLQTSATVSEQTSNTDHGAEELEWRGVILLAEDNAANILTTADYLETYDYQVIVAHDGVEAIQKAEEIHPDLILMDIQMPVMDGMEAIQRLRSDSRFASTPIIALTALAMPGDRERCIAAGANEYISKPASLKALLNTIRELLSK